MTTRYKVGDFVIPQYGLEHPLFDYRYQSIGIIGRVHLPKSREPYYEVFPLYSNPYKAPLLPADSPILHDGYKHYLKASFDCIAAFLLAPTLSNESKFTNRPNQFRWTTFAVRHTRLIKIDTLEEGLNTRIFRDRHSERYPAFDKYNEKSLASLSRLFTIKTSFERVLTPSLLL